MKKILILAVGLFFVSCSTKQKFIYYTYNNITVSRLDKENHIFFYYGKIKNLNNLPKSYIEATYSGFDGLVWGYLIFKENKNIEIKVLEGDFYKIGENSNIEIINEDNPDYINWHNKEKRNYDNVLEFRDVIKSETKVNKINNSQVKVIYPIE